MNIDYSKLTGNEFAELQGERLMTNDTVDNIIALSYQTHGDMDVACRPTWTTKVQDIIEQTCVTRYCFTFKRRCCRRKLFGSTHCVN